MNTQGARQSADWGLLIIRVGIGAMFIVHGLPKLLGGPPAWAGLGQAMDVFGVRVFPAFWGFMAAFSECFGGMALILGLFFRTFCFLLAFTMTVAATMHLDRGHGLLKASHAIELGIVFVGLLFTGPGRFSSRLRLSPKGRGENGKERG